MSKFTAVVSILFAFFGGLAIGRLVGAPTEPDEIVAEGEAGSESAARTPAGAGEQSAEGGDGSDTERFRVPVSADQPQKGPADALVTIVEFSEFQCPFCTRVLPTTTELMSQYAGRLRIVWRNNPLPFHQDAKQAAELAMEAFAQGGAAKFWQAHDLLFQNQRALARADLDRYAQQLGLDMARYRRAMDEHTHLPKIEADMALAARLGARGTPGFLINGRLLMGAQPIDQFKQIIDDEIRRAEQLIGTGIPRARVYAEITRNGRTQAAPEPAAAGGAAPEADRVYTIPVPPNAPSKGPATAPVTIQLFSDFQCPFCSRVGPTLEQIVREYGPRVRIVWRNFPLDFHQDAMPAAELAMEAYAQGGNAKFWQVHDLLFQNQRALARADLERYAEQAGLNVVRVRQALDQHTHQARVRQDMDAVRAAGAQIGTPSLFVNGRLVQGAQPFEAFRTVIDRELVAAGVR